MRYEHFERFAQCCGFLRSCLRNYCQSLSIWVIDFFMLFICLLLKQGVSFKLFVYICTLA